MNTSPKSSFKIFTPGDYFFLISLVIALIITSRYNYLLFHSLVEIAIASTGFITFAFTWHLRRFDLGYLVLLGILLGCTAVISVFHFLAFNGMGVFSGGPNLATQLWIVSRYQFSLFLFAAAVVQNSTFNSKVWLSALVLSTVTFLSVVFFGDFPDCYTEGIGQTRFKIVSEYIISAILFLTMMLFWRTRKTLHSGVSPYILIFLVFSILTELVFTSYFNIHDFSNMLGHLFHLVGSYVLYKAIVHTGLKNPYELMFKNLNDAIKARDEFISMASHELKTPLTPLKLQLQMLQRGLQHSERSMTDEQIRKIAHSSNLQINRLSKLIDGMLDVTRLSTGVFEVYREETDLEELIIDLIKRHEVQATLTKTAIHLKLTKVIVNVDLIRIEQVLTNLLTNTLKYAPGSNVEIELKRNDDGKAKISFTDSGPGISEENKKKIFNRYERGAADSSIGGLGLGLFISRQMIEAHGGTLIVESEIGKGSKFIITI